MRNRKCVIYLFILYIIWTGQNFLTGNNLVFHRNLWTDLGEEKLVFFNKHLLPATNTLPGFVLVFCEHMEDLTNLKPVKYIWLYSASKIPVLVSAHV